MRIAAAICLSLCLFAPPLRAERLPITLYTVADGLAHNGVACIVRDSHGYLWFCTAEGLSRFDGYRFTTYSTEQGLPHRVVNDLVENGDGTYWIATASALARFDPTGSLGVVLQSGSHGDSRLGTTSAKPMFTTYRSEYHGQPVQFSSVLRDHTGTIWCGTNRGLLRLQQTAAGSSLQQVDLRMPTPDDEDRAIDALAEDRSGQALWIGANQSGLYRLGRDGTVTRYTQADGLAGNSVHVLLAESDGALWVGGGNGLTWIDTASNRNPFTVRRVYTTAEGLPKNWIYSLHRASDRTLWVGTSFGFAAVRGADQSHVQSYTSAHAAEAAGISAIAEDEGGNLWIGSQTSGALKLRRNGFTTFGPEDGLPLAGVGAIYEDKAGDVCIASAPDWVKMRLYCSQGDRFDEIHPKVPEGLRAFGWGWSQITFQARDGAWWLPSGEGLYRFPPVQTPHQLEGAPSQSCPLTTGLSGVPRKAPTPSGRENAGAPDEYRLSRISIARWSSLRGRKAAGHSPEPNRVVRSCVVQNRPKDGPLG